MPTLDTLRIEAVAVPEQTRLVRPPGRRVGQFVAGPRHRPPSSPLPPKLPTNVGRFRADSSAPSRTVTCATIAVFCGFWMLMNRDGWGSGGEGGIRTLGTKSTTVFETAPIDRSGTSPRGPGHISRRRTRNPRKPNL